MLSAHARKFGEIFKARAGSLQQWRLFTFVQSAEEDVYKNSFPRASKFFGNFASYIQVLLFRFVICFVTCVYAFLKTLMTRLRL